MVFVQNKCAAAYWLFITLFIQLLVTKFAVGDTCWSSSNTCTIHATYYSNPKAEIEISRELNCNNNAHTNENKNKQNFDYDFISSTNVSINGCNAPLNAPTYGIEYLTNCDRLIAMIVERFQTDELLPVQCLRAKTNQLKYLEFRNNDVHLVNRKAFDNLYQLEQLHFTSNTIQYIEDESFDEIHTLKIFNMQNELLYHLHSYMLFRNTSIEYLKLASIKGISGKLFQNLPDTLLSLSVENTPIDGKAVEIANSQQLRYISLPECSLQRFTLMDNYSSVQHVNLSGNFIMHFQVSWPESSAIETLDLSHNHLEMLPNGWTEILPKLKKLHMHSNKLKTLSLETLFGLTANEISIDLSENQLTRFEDVTSLENYYTMRLKIDRNPWHCKWLIEFSQKHPNLLHLFQYDKYISRINVNGLECIADVVEPLEVTENPKNKEEIIESVDTISNHTIPHLSQYIIGGPWEVKHSQRAEALIIVFMLPLGISFLFLLLYLWIHCHKIFSLSYYQSIPKNHHHTATPTTEINQLPNNMSNTMDGYEVPLNIEVPKYHQTIGNNVQHTTYDCPPGDTARSIYEEVYDVDHPKNTAVPHPLYEHLSYT